MSSLRPVGRSAAARKNDRKSLCRFTFADGRQCRTPRSPGHLYFCSDHARKDSQSRAADKTRQQTILFLLRRTPFRLRSQRRPRPPLARRRLRRH